MTEDGEQPDAFRWISGAMTASQRLHWQRVLVALLRVHSDAYVIEWLCEHQKLTAAPRAAREAVVLADYALID